MKNFFLPVVAAGLSAFTCNADLVVDHSSLGDGADSLRILTGVPDGYTMVWSDEFDDPSSLTQKWKAMDWAPGRVNHELQTYRPGDQAIKSVDGSLRHTAEISDGKLLINCFKGEDGNIYSGRLDSHDAGNGLCGYKAWRYGFMEARIKLPSGKGTWPAFWMMPARDRDGDEGWPVCGEIDIMEEVGFDPDVCVCSLHAIGHYHANNTQVSGVRSLKGMEGSWITYAMEWTPDTITMYADGYKVLSYPNDHNGHVNWPYDRPYFITLNLAWGGDWGGARGVDESVLPVTMEIDYVRVYQRDMSRLEDSGLGTAYICGPYNAVALNGLIPSEGFDTSRDNFIPLEDNDTVHTRLMRVGKDFDGRNGRFLFTAIPANDGSGVFTPDGEHYRVTLEENPVITISSDGELKLRDGVVLDGGTIQLTLDCTAGVGNAIARVVYSPLK